MPNLGFLHESGSITLDYQKKLNSIVNQIKSINKDTERVFLEIGNNLQKYTEQSKFISNISGNLVESITKNVIEYGFDNLTKIIAQLNNYFSKSIANIKNDKNELISIQQFINNISSEIYNFKKIVKHLRVLGISTKIEIARLGTDDKGFSSLVQNVDRLSEIIEQKAGNINQQSGYLLSEISKTNNDLDNLHNEQERLSKDVLDSASSSLDDFKVQYNANKLFIEKTFEKSKNITKSIGEVVIAIQFHDITRQQIEHVEEALINLSKKISTDNEELLDLELIYDTCEIQVEQLNHAANKFVEAVQDIIEKLNLIYYDFNEIDKQSEKLFNTGKKNEKTQLEFICEKLTGIASTLTKNTEIEKQLEKSINTVVDIVDELAHYVEEIESIGDEIEIIALNAIIKAAHVGNEGSALGILAESIQKLSIEAKEQTSTIITKLENVNSLAKGLRISLRNTSIKEELLVEGELQTIIEKILNNESLAKDQFLLMNNKINEIKKEINMFSSNINIHNNFMSSANNIISELNLILNSIHPQLKPRIKRNLNESLYKKYTMKSEREIHDRIINNKKLIEPEENRESNSEFGENVELF